MEIKKNEIVVRFYEDSVKDGKEKKFLDELNKIGVDYCHLKNDTLKYKDGIYPEAEQFEKANIWTA